MNTVTRKIEKSARSQKRRTNGESSSRSERPADAVWFVAIFALAFFLRWIHLAQVESIPLFYHLAGDGWTYDEWGQRIAAGDWLGQGVFYQAPLYPYFLGVVPRLFGANLWLIRLLPIFLGSLA